MKYDIFFDYKLLFIIYILIILMGITIILKIKMKTSSRVVENLTKSKNE